MVVYCFYCEQATNFTAKPNNPHWTVLKKNFGYLGATVDLGHSYATGKNNPLSDYTDADWAEL